MKNKEKIIGISVLILLIIGVLISGCENSSITSPTPDADYQNSPFGISIAGFLSNQDYEQSLGYMRESGASTVRFMSKWGGLIWSKVEEQQDTYNWSFYDERFLAAKHQRLNIMVNIYTDIPNWSSQGQGCANEYPEGELMENYIDFIQKAAERYDGDGIDDAPGSPVVDSWILGCEMERRDPEWNCMNAKEYADLFIKTHDAIKRANPKATIMSYGCNIIGHSWDFEKFTKPWLGELNDLTKNRSDFNFIYSIHYYPSKEYDVIDYISEGKNLLNEVGFSETPIAITDMGMWVNERFLPEGRKRVAGNMLKSYVQALAYDVNPIVWAQISDGGHSVSYEAGLISKDTGLKNHLFYSYKLMTEKLEGSDWDNIQTIQEANEIYIYKFTNKETGKPTWVAWSDNGGQTVILDVGNTNSVEITKAVPNAESGLDLNENDYPNFFNKETKSVDNGRVTLTLDEIPVFVEKAEKTIPSTQLRLKQVIGETRISPEDGRYARVEIIAINNRLIAAFNNIDARTFQLVELNKDLSYKSSIFDIFSDSPPHEPTDIRLATDSKNLWYAFESILKGKPSCDNHILNIVKYDISGTNPVLMNYKLDIARGCPTTRRGYQNPPDEIPENPEAVDDPTPIFHSGKYVVLGNVPILL